MRARGGLGAQGWRGLARAVAAVVRAVVGAPDYQRYLVHMRRHHPVECPLSEGEFIRRRLDARYSRPGSRCC